MSRRDEGGASGVIHRLPDVPSMSMGTKSTGARFRVLQRVHPSGTWNLLPE